MSETLYLQRTLISEASVLVAAMDRPELMLKGWKARGPGRVMLLAGWLLTRTSATDVKIDLRGAALTPTDGAKLAELMRCIPKLTSVDVRNNESLMKEGAVALVEWLQEDKRSGSHTLRSLTGICPAQSRMDVPRYNIKPIELSLICAELETNTFAEGVSAGMGSKGGGANVSSLNRRGHSSVGEWQPLIWAAKDNNLLVATHLLDHGTDVNLVEPMEDKGCSCYTALHWAALRGFQEMGELLLGRGANTEVADKHGNTPLMLAEKKGNKELSRLLQPKTCLSPSQRPNKPKLHRGNSAPGLLSPSKMKRIDTDDE